MLNPQKDENSRNRKGGSARSIFQKIQRIHELAFLYASFMLLLRHFLCLLYTNSASTKKLCYVVLWLLVSFIILQISCVTLIICFYVYFMLWCCYDSQYVLCFYEETFSPYCFTCTQKHIFNGLVTILDFSKHNNMLF